jgi:uncharacterized caspase-like protein
MRMMSRSSILPALILASLVSAHAQDRDLKIVQVQRRQALIIGNSDYPDTPLRNPVNDAAAMETTLRKLGFETVTLRNLGLRAMANAIDDFTVGLAPGSLGFFYFAGHGVQVNSINYLLPVDFSARSEADVEFVAYPAPRIQKKMEESRARLRVLVLDACRNNPFHYKRDALSGLAGMAVNAEGTLIAFSTGDNNTADDNLSGQNGLYTQHLIPARLSPGLQLHDVFRKAKDDVYAASRHAQNPAIYDNVVGDFYLQSPPASVTQAAPSARFDAAAEAWSLLKDSKNPEDFEGFAKAFPASDLARAAELRSAQLRRDVAVAAAPKLDPARTADALRPGRSG